MGKCQCNLIKHHCSCGMIPERLRDFMLDQHTLRKHTIPEYLPEFAETVSTQLPLSYDATYVPDLLTMDVDEESELPLPVVSDPKPSRYVFRYDALNFAMMCDRFGISDRVASCLATALFRDIEFKDKNGTFVVMDKNKVAREKKKCRDLLRLQQCNNSDLLAFSFDGKKDNSIADLKIDDKLHRRIVKESHMVILREPHAEFLGHVTVTAEDAGTKQRELYKFFDEKQINLSSLIGICCDGEPTNTGTESGILRRFEIALKKPLHWFVCLLHFNELPLRHLFAALDKSVTKGPRNATGPLAKLIETCEQHPVS